MTAFVALSRGLNVVGHKAVGMADLRAMGERLGFVKVRTFLQSGNLVFEAKAAKPDKIEGMLEEAAEKTFGHRIVFLVRTASEWDEICARNPFRQEATDDPSHWLVMCLRDEPATKDLAALKAAVKGREYFRAMGRELYVVYPDGIGRSKLTGALIESKLGTRGTARNWNTVRKIAELLTVGAK